MDQAPARIQRLIPQQPFHRPRPQMRLHLRHLRHLFRHMNMHRPRSHPHDSRQPRTRNRPKRMRGHPQNRIRRQSRPRPLRPLPQPPEALHIIAEPQLPRRQRPPVAAAPLIQHRQQRQPQPGLRRRRSNPPRHLGRIAVNLPPRRVVQIVELADACIARLRHLQHHHRRNRLHILRRQPLQKPVHQRPPRPE